MNMFLNFEEFLNESTGVARLEYENSPFAKFPEFVLKTGKLNNKGKIATFIYYNQGLTNREIMAKMLNKHMDTPEKDMYNRGGHQVHTILMSVSTSPYIMRSDERPTRWYARTDTTSTIDQIKHKHRGSITAKNFGI